MMDHFTIGRMKPAPPGTNRSACSGSATLADRPADSRPSPSIRPHIRSAASLKDLQSPSITEDVPPSPATRSLCRILVQSLSFPSQPPNPESKKLNTASTPPSTTLTYLRSKRPMTVTAPTMREPSISAVHKALAIDDILVHLFEQFPKYGHFGRATLSALARTCRSFTEPALNILWRDLRSQSFGPLLRLMPPGVLMETQTGWVSTLPPMRKYLGLLTYRQEICSTPYPERLDSVYETCAPRSPNIIQRRRQTL